MKYYTLEELKESVLACFSKGLRDKGNSCIEAASYCCLIYEADFEYGLTERVVCSILIGTIMLENTNRVFVGQRNMFKNACKDALLNESKLDLDEAERTKIIKLAKELLNKLTNVQIEQDPRAI